MKRYLSLIFPAVMCFAMQSCEKELDIKYKDINPITVIEGQLTLDGATVRLTLTTPMDEPFNNTSLTDADVVITDLTSSLPLSIAVDDSGNYVSATPGVPGHEYELTVTRDGNHYSSTCFMPSPSEIIALQFNWIKMPYDDVAVLQVTFTDDTDIAGQCYWVRLYRNGHAYMWNIVTDIYSADGIINDAFRTSRRDLSQEDEATALREGDIITASVAPISRAMYDYLEAVSSDTSGPRLFTGDLCLGYFLAAPVATASITFQPAQIPTY